DTASVLALPCKAKGGRPFPPLSRKLSTYWRVVPTLTCWRSKKCGELVETFRKVIVPVAGRVAAPPKRRFDLAVTVADECGAARVTAGPVRVSFWAWVG